MSHDANLVYHDACGARHFRILACPNNNWEAASVDLDLGRVEYLANAGRLPRTTAYSHTRQ
jgi:hypothetical protein